MPHDGDRGVVDASSRSPFFVSFRVSGAGMVGVGWCGAPSLFFTGGLVSDDVHRSVAI